MLVLSRQRNEAVRIGDEIIVRVIDIRGDKVRLGFDAPRMIPVHREEVFQAIKSRGDRMDALAAGIQQGDFSAHPFVGYAGIFPPGVDAVGRVTHDGGPDIADGAPSDGDCVSAESERAA